MLDTSTNLIEEPTRVRQLMSIAKVALPAVMTFILQNLAELINTYFIGRHLNDP